MANALAKGVAAFRRAAHCLEDPLNGAMQGLWFAETLDQCFAVDMPWLEQNPLALNLPGARDVSETSSSYTAPLRNPSCASRSQPGGASSTAKATQSRSQSAPSGRLAPQAHVPVITPVPSAPQRQQNVPANAHAPASSGPGVSATAPPQVAMPAQRTSDKRPVQTPTQRTGPGATPTSVSAPSSRMSTPDVGFSLGALSRTPLTRLAQGSSNMAAPATLKRGSEPPHLSAFKDAPALGSESVTPAQGSSVSSKQDRSEQGTGQSSPGLQLLSSLVDRLYRGISEPGSTQGASVISQGDDGRHNRAMGVPQRMRNPDTGILRKPPATHPSAPHTPAPDPLTHSSRNPLAPALATSQPPVLPGATASPVANLGRSTQPVAGATQQGMTQVPGSNLITQGHSYAPLAANTMPTKTGLPYMRPQQDTASNPYGADVVVTAVPTSSSPLASLSPPVPSQNLDREASSAPVFRDSYEEALEQAQRIDHVLRDQARRQGVDLS